MLIDTLITQFSQMGDKETKFAMVLTHALRFQVDNVAKYHHENIYRNSPEEHLPYRLEEHIPNIAPLANNMWFEYSGASIRTSPFHRCGCLITVVYEREYWKDHKMEYAKLGMSGLASEETRWILRAEYFLYAEGNNEFEIGVSDWIYFFHVGNDGSFLGAVEQENWKQGSTYQPPDDTERRCWHEEIVISLLAICFAHCKGTVIEEHKPTRQVRRAAERTGKPIFTFHTIDIHPSATALRTEGHISENGLAKALHICRGHFAHYTAEKPLFGKYTGTFYRPMHVRGTAEAGVTIKDYRVHPQER